MYAALLAIFFFGADVALSVLGNSVKPRGQLPAFLGGLEVYFILVPGVASVALGELARQCVIACFSAVRENAGQAAFRAWRVRLLTRNGFCKNSENSVNKL
jgi:hypothetical protein